MKQCHPRIWTPALVRPNYKLNCVWCTVELKVIGNLECRIKFYREKKTRHFFYTIEYPYPPTNSVHVCFIQQLGGGGKVGPNHTTAKKHGFFPFYISMEIPLNYIYTVYYRKKRDLYTMYLYRHKKNSHDHIFCIDITREITEEENKTEMSSSHMLTQTKLELWLWWCVGRGCGPVPWRWYMYMYVVCLGWPIWCVQLQLCAWMTLKIT